MIIKRLVYQRDSCDIFARLLSLPYPVLLDSTRSQQAYGRYDIMSADPFELIAEADFERIQTALDQLKSTDDQPQSIDLPFKYGAIGYFSYELAEELHPLAKRPKNSMTLPHSMVGIYAWSIVVDHQQQTSWFISHGVDQTRWRQINALLQSKHTPHFNHFSLNRPFQTDMPKAHYDDAFHTIKKYIRQGDCYQVNFCQRFSSDFQGSAFNAYRLIRQHQPGPFAAFMQFGKSAILSVSPERFISVKQGVAETKPIKGTSPRFADPQQDQRSAHALLNNSKERAENLMIVDLLRNDFGKCCVPGSIQVPELIQLKSFSNVHHLVSTITGQLQAGWHAVDLLKACFPGGSITGTPKLSAMQIIHQLEPVERSIYCGSLAYFDIDGNMDSSICIRTLICHHAAIYCYAGGAIVADSILENEYQETLLKVGKMLKALETTCQTANRPENSCALGLI